MNKLNGRITTSATMRGALTRGAGGGTYVEANPEGEATDILEKLMVKSDIFEIRNVPGTASAHNGDVLTKIASGVAWLPPAKELPTYTSGNEGQSLKIVNGSPIWADSVKFSTDERTVGTWIDGSKVYEKTIQIVSMPNNSSLTLPTPTGLKYLLNAEGFIYSAASPTNQRFVPFSGGGINDIRIDVNAGSIRIMTFNSWSDYTGYLTIRYTKVGD